MEYIKALKGAKKALSHLEKEQIKKVKSIEKEMKEVLSELNEDQKTAMEKLLEFLKEEHSEDNIDGLYTKAFELLELEKQQLVEFFVAGFRYAAEKLEVEFEITQEYLDIAKIVAEEYYEDIYLDNIEDTK